MKLLKRLITVLVCVMLCASVLMVFEIKPFSNIPLAYATGSEATSFTWKTRGHDVYGTGQDWSATKLWTSAISINSTSSQQQEFFVFEGINRTWLDGKYFRWCWGGYYNSSGTNNEQTFFVQVYDGQYDRTNDTEFPKGSALLEKGAGLLQEYSQNCTPGNFAPEVHELLLDTSSGTEDNATIFFRLLDPWTYDTLNLVLFWTEISTSSGGVSVLKGGHFTDSIHWAGGNYTSYIVTGGAALQISTVSSTFSTWTESVDVAYLGYSLGKTTLTQLQTEIDKLSNSSWLDILFWYAVTKKFGLENQTTIERALTNAVILTNGLPNSTHIYDTSAFLVYDRYALLGYNWSEQYSYETAKWNKTLAFESFKTAVDTYGQPPLWVYENNTAYAYSGDPRYYDEVSETIDVFLTFDSIGVSDALTEAEKWWEWMNTNLWNETGGFFQYKVSQLNAFECEAGGMEQIIWRLFNTDGSIANISRMLTDTQTRFLDSGWDSPQWTFQTNPSYYVVNHEHSGTYEERLSNTVMAWSAILGAYRNLSATYQDTLRKMLNGSAFDASAPIPAWALLGSKPANLWSGTKFKWTGAASTSNGATADAAALMLNLAVVPETGSIAIPLEEYEYEYQYAMIDRDLFHINLTTYTLRFPVGSAGNFTFMFGGIPFEYELNQTGLWDLTFASDWNSITTGSRISALPSNRVYLTRVMYPDADLNIHVLNSDGLPLDNATVVVNAYDTETTYYSDVNGWVNVSSAGTTTYKVAWQGTYVYGLNTTIIEGVDQTADAYCNVFALHIHTIDENATERSALCTITTPSLVAYGYVGQTAPTTFTNLANTTYTISTVLAGFINGSTIVSLTSNKTEIIVMDDGPASFIIPTASSATFYHRIETRYTYTQFGYCLYPNLPTGSATDVDNSLAGTYTVYYGVRVYVLTGFGSATEKTSGVSAIVQRTIDGTGLQTGYWNSPASSGVTTVVAQGLMIKVYQQFSSQGWSLVGTYVTTETLNYKLPESTWTFRYYTNRTVSGGVTYAKFWFGDSTYPSSVQLYYLTPTAPENQQVALFSGDFVGFILAPFMFDVGGLRINVLYLFLILILGITMYQRHEDIIPLGLFLLLFMFSGGIVLALLPNGVLQLTFVFIAFVICFILYKFIKGKPYGEY